MISSDTKIIFWEGMTFEMRRFKMNSPYKCPDAYLRAREWVYEKHHTEVLFDTMVGTNLNGKWYPHYIWFADDDLRLMFNLSFPELYCIS